MWKAIEMTFDGTVGPDRGWVTMPERPGLGLEPKLDALGEWQDKGTARA